MIDLRNSTHVNLTELIKSSQSKIRFAYIEKNKNNKFKRNKLLIFPVKILNDFSESEIKKLKKLKNEFILSIMKYKEQYCTDKPDIKEL